MRPPLVCTALVLTVVAAACSGRSGAVADSTVPVASAATPPASASCTPLETRPPEVAGQQPATPGQTRACAVTSNVAFDVTVVAKGLEKPWAVEPLPGGDLLVTEKPGRMRIVSANGALGDPLSGLPKVDAGGQGGLLDVALSPGFASDRTIYWSFTEPRDGGNATSVARGVLSADRRSLEGVRVIYQTMPVYRGSLHFGSRLAFGPDGMLYVTLGERSDAPMRPQAQALDSDLGKILRLTPDGAVPPDNPFAGQANARPAIWSLGHRNVQAAAFDGEGRLWIVEHGTRGGDELNLVEKGKNYGWPLQAYGMEYRGAHPISSPAGDAATTREGMQQPVYYWDPVIAPSGAQWYTGDAFPAWKGSLFVGALKEKRLVRLVIENDRVSGEEHLLVDRDQRVRDVRQGGDGALYVVTDQANGELWRLAPRP
jgi:aldose sugar dehydrogenase